MQVGPEQLAQRLARGLQPLYTVIGDEPLQAQEAADAIRAAARSAGYTERRVFTVAGAHFDWSAVLGAAQEMSLFAERQVIEIRIPSGKPGRDGSEALQRYCERITRRGDADLLTLVQLPQPEWRDAKAAWLQALDAAGLTVRVETPPRRALPAWLAQRLARQGQRVAEGEEGRQALEFFADQVEGNLLAAHQELQKLALLHPPGELSLAQLQAAVMDVARFELPLLAQALWRGDAARMLRVLEGLRSGGEAVVRVHWQLAEDLRALAAARAAVDAGTPPPLALREARVFGSRQALLEPALPRLAGHHLAHLLEGAQVCDGICKGLRHPDWPADPWQALQRLALSACRAVMPAPATRAAPR